MSRPLNTHLPIIHLKSGEIHFSDHPELVVTVLGSCISIIMHYARFKLTAVSHSLLPRRCGSRDQEHPRRYIDTTFREMYDWFIQHGVKPHEVEVKVFGGSDVLQKSKAFVESLNKTVGAENIEAVLELILSEGLTISAIDVGGESGRKLFVYTETGEVRLKKIKHSEVDSASLKLEKQIKKK